MLGEDSVGVVLLCMERIKRESIEKSSECAY